ncbi:MAG: AAA family ATPase [Bacteroidales bacterium]|nr:AAA family ATPase [Bacteroidales bacterium]
MLRNFISERLLENLDFQPTLGQEDLIRELGVFLTAEVSSEIMLVKGYAGTGKTTLLKSLVKTLSELKQKSVLLAPTGRAAKVLTAYSGHPAWTIHKKIYRQKSGKDGLGEFVLDRNLHKNTCFIVDEASMIGDRSPQTFFGSGDLLRDLLDYVEAGSQCRLVLVGDTAQLPPVGLDLSPALNRERLESFGYRVREIELCDVVRQAEDSGILHNATSIRNLITDGLEDYPRFHFDSFPDISMISGDELLETISASYDRYGTSDTIVVTRSNKRANKFNAGIRNQILWREEQMSPGDLLMVVKNNYFWKDDDKRVDFIANGDIIRVEKVLSTEEVHGHKFANILITLPDYQDMELEVKVLLDVIDLEAPSLNYEQQKTLYLSVAEDYPDEPSKKKVAEKISTDPYYNALQVKFAYAVTCHKAQGGQWKSVFLDQGYFTDEMLSLDYLRWLYTAFTRASEKLYLVNFAKQFTPR